MIRILNRQRKYRVDASGLTRMAARLLEELGRRDSDVTIVFVSDRTIRQLNRRFRGVDRPTDVLAFCYESGAQLQWPEHEAYLGDVVISPETAWRYAAKLQIPFERELKHLIIHGLVHLCGYDHETDGGEMKRLEHWLWRRLMMSETAEQTESAKRLQASRQHSQSRR